jgi:integrase
MDSLDISEETKADHYRYIRKMIIKAKPELYSVDWFLSSKLAPSTFNKRKSYLSRCFDWALSSKLVSVNPWASVKSRKQDKELLEPFSIDELKLILEGFQTHKAYFYSFVKFLMLTGLRLSEAIGLQWKNINFARGEITINESMPIDRTKNMYKRKRKTTKTGSIRILTINEQLRELLESIPKSEKDDLVFHSCRGFTISDHQFRGVWKTVLELQGIPYRRPHILRHTLLSMAIESGIPISGVAYLAGHSTVQTVIKTYLHIINRPNLPNIDI